jgi:hypothetical protein
MGLDQYAYFKHKDYDTKKLTYRDHRGYFEFDRFLNRIENAHLDKDSRLNKGEFYHFIDRDYKQPKVGEKVLLTFENSYIIAERLKYKEYDDVEDFGQYFYKFKTIHIQENCSEDFYWRKHHCLHKYMGELWLSKSENSDKNHGDFNCVDLELSLDDLNTLEDVIKNDNLPLFENGHLDSDELKQRNLGHKSYDLEFVEAAKAAIEKEYKVIYSSWW